MACIATEKGRVFHISARTVFSDVHGNFIKQIIVISAISINRILHKAQRL